MFGDDRRYRTVQRQELYDQVWSRPMTTLAKEYGISDVALAKICKKLNVPYPWRGYWRRKETGKAVKQLPLPPNSDPTKQSATIQRTIRLETIEPLSEETTQRIKSEQAPEQTIQVPDRLTKPHRLLQGHLTEWRSASVDKYGAIGLGSIRQLNIRVSTQSLSRALRIMNTLFHALEARGYPVEIQEGYKQTLITRINGEPIEFGIEEKFKQIDHPDRNNPRLEPWQRERYQYLPSGVLSLKITEWAAEGLQRSWRDSKTTNLETCLNDFVVGLLKVADAKKALRLKQEREEKIREEAARRRQEEERKRQEELARRQALEEEAADWAKAQQLRAYLAVLKAMLVSKHGEIRQGSPADQWLAWAHQHADRLDSCLQRVG